MATPSASTNPGVADTTRDTFIPLFNNKPQDYKEWRMRIKLYQKKLEIQKKNKEATLNLLTSLTGVSWRQVEHMVDKVTEEEDGFDKVLAQLDKCFKYDDRVEMPRALERFFYGAVRRGDQTLMQYCADHRETRRELEKHKITLPDSVSGWLLLRRSSLTHEQRQMVQTHCTSLEETKIEESMYYLFGQDYRGRNDVQWRGANARTGHRWPRRGYAYTAEEAYEYDEEDFPEDDYSQDFVDASEEAYYENAEEDYDPSWDGQAADGEVTEETYYQGEADEYDGVMEEAYAAYLDARRQFANLRAARGYFPVVALSPDASPGSTGAQYPLSPTSSISSKGRGKSKGKRKGSVSKGKGRNANPPQKGTPSSRAASYFGSSANCFICGKPGHLAAQ
eukprot:s915_g12.t1